MLDTELVNRTTYTLSTEYRYNVLSVDDYCKNFGALGFVSKYF
jgi:hypothetical protein